MSHRDFQKANRSSTGNGFDKATPTPTLPLPRRRVVARRPRRRGGRRGYQISPDLAHTEEAFRVDLDRVAPGAFVTVSVRHPIDDQYGTGDIAVVHAHLPGDLYLQWGLGTEDEGGALSPDPWEAPPTSSCPRVPCVSRRGREVLTPCAPVQAQRQHAGDPDARSLTKG